MRRDGRMSSEALDGPVVVVAQGALRGRDDSGVRVFKGIPYARPPTGPLRFRPPQPAQPWDGVRPAMSFAPAAPQPADPGLYPGDPAAMPRVAMDEDCLTLNVWAPREAGPHPVLVWLHGGGQILGGTARPVYDGAAFARAGIVCVTVGHRLGALGFLAVPPFDGEEPSVNLALADQIAALRWVRDNIGAFGGVPGRVTLGGESAGGKNVAALMASPAANGLFQAAVIQSGGGDTIHDLAAARNIMDDFLAVVGVGVRDLQRMPVSEVLAAQDRVVARAMPRFPFRPVTGTLLLPKPPVEALATNLTDRRPLLIGTSRDEIGPTIAPHDLDGGWPARLLAHHTAEAATVVEARLPPALARRSLADRRRAIISAENYVIPAIRLADANAASGAATWMYRFDLPLPSGPLAGSVPHTADLAPSWAHPSRFDEVPGRPARSLHRILVDFIRSHEIRWPRYECRSRKTALIGTETIIADDPSAELVDLFA